MSAALVLLIRHGESTWNADGRWQGQADPPLSEVGEVQATEGAAGLEAAGVTAVHTSHLQRARRTGELLAAGAGLPLGEPISALAERAAGPWEGLTRVQIEARFPGYLAEDRRPEGYESDADIIGRVVPALTTLVASVTTPIAAVSHGGVINALERGEGEPWQRLANLEARWFSVEGDRVRPVGERLHLIDPEHETRQAKGYA